MDTGLTKAIDAIGGKWRLGIIAVLANGTCRFNALQRNVPGVTARVLSSELKALEALGLVGRSVRSATLPMEVNYSITEKCNELFPIIRCLEHWGESLPTSQPKINK